MITINATQSDKISGPSIVSIGNFDGIHTGHKRLINKLVLRAKKNSAKSIIITFEPHTRTYLDPTNPPSILTIFMEKRQLLMNMGVDVIVALDFDKTIVSMSPSNFIEKILINRFGAVEWVMGVNHHFGKNKSGASNFIHNDSGKNHFKLVSVDLLSENMTIASSTAIRSLIHESQIDKAVRMLGHPYPIFATRIKGLQKGTEMGYPTLNFSCPPSNKCIPTSGVYAAEAECCGVNLRGALYFGNCPTFGNRDLHFEFYSFDPIPKEPVVKAFLWLHQFIRAGKTFSNQNLLVDCITQDIQFIKNYFTKE